MPLGEIASGILELVWRAVGHLFLDIILEILVRGAGYLIIKPFYGDKAPDDTLALVAGFAFWIAVGLIIYSVYSGS